MCQMRFSRVKSHLYRYDIMWEMNHLPVHIVVESIVASKSNQRA